MWDIRLLGCGGMMPLPGRHLTALTLRYGGHLLLIDCGEGTQVSMRLHKTGFKNLDTILLTHLHADHTAGLPGLLLTVGNSGRTEPLTVYGPAGTAALIESVKTIAPEISFEIRASESEVPFEADFHGCRIEAFPCEHAVPCFGYRIRLPRAGLFSAEKAREKNIPVRYWRRLQAGVPVTVDGTAYVPGDVLGPERKGLRLVYCTDTRPVPELCRALEGADLAVLEGMYLDAADDRRAVEKQHMTMREAAEAAEKAGAGRLWLTHYSPKVPPFETLPEEITAICPAAEPGFDGKHLKLGYTE